MIAPRLTAPDFTALRAEVRESIAKIQLGPVLLGKRAFAGAVLGKAPGQSTEFHDQRPYQFGDDPRTINWRAYARTGSLILKQFRQESAPRIDILIDTSASMAYEPGKLRIGFALLLLCIELGRVAGADIRCHRSRGGRATALDIEALRNGELEFDSRREDGLLPLSVSVPWRAEAVRLILSDLLFPEVASTSLRSVSATSPHVVILSPWTRFEATPDWDGSVELLDCEGGNTKHFTIAAESRRTFGEAYARHFESWRSACMAQGVLFARVQSDKPLLQALLADAIPRGIFAPCRS